MEDSILPILLFIALAVAASAIGATHKIRLKLDWSEPSVL